MVFIGRSLRIDSGSPFSPSQHTMSASATLRLAQLGEHCRPLLRLLAAGRPLRSTTAGIGASAWGLYPDHVCQFPDLLFAQVWKNQMDAIKDI